MDENEAITLLPKALVISFKERKKTKKRNKHESRRRKSKEQFGPLSASDSELEVESKHKTFDSNLTEDETCSSGEEFFDKFIEENRECYWNPHLEESLKNVHFVGYLHPGTILLGGRDIYLGTIRSAWSRRVLRPPYGYNIHSVGEIGQVAMSVVIPTQFTPLPEALCITISGLRRVNQLADLDSILDTLAEKYHGMQQPSEQIVYETLDSLIKERKIYHTGDGYEIVMPDSFIYNCPDPLCPGDWHCRQPNHRRKSQNKPKPQPAKKTGDGGPSTVYVPVLPPGACNTATDMRSISCQTGTDGNIIDMTRSLDEGDYEEFGEDFEKNLKNTPKKKSKLERSNSLKVSKKDRIDTLTRSRSLRYGSEKLSSLPPNLDAADSLHKDKAKKSSLFNKIFSHKKKSKPGTIIEETLDESKSASSTKSPPSSPQKQEVELATFSAQFPPPEWQWVKLRQDMMVSQATNVRSKTWNQGRQPPNFQEYMALHDAGLDKEWKSNTLPGQVQVGSHRTRLTLHDDVHQSRGSMNHDRARSHSEKRHEKKHRKSNHKNSSRNKHVDNVYYEPEEFSSNRHRGLKEQSSHSQRQKPHNSSSNDEVKEFPYYPFLGSSLDSTNDISIKHIGKMPRKNAPYSKSRDSGVNCAGLGEGHDRLRHSMFADKPDSPLTLAHLTDHSTPNPGLSSARNAHHRVTLHEVEVHQTSFPSPAIQQDSGFSSPRTDSDQADRSFYALKNLNNINNNNNNINHFDMKKDFTGDKKKSTNQYPAISCESITGSEMYPNQTSSMQPLHSPVLSSEGSNHSNNSNNWSQSSRQTVLEVQHQFNDIQLDKHVAPQNSHVDVPKVDAIRRNLHSDLTASQSSRSHSKLQKAAQDNARLARLGDVQVVGVV